VELSAFRGERNPYDPTILERALAGHKSFRFELVNQRSDAALSQLQRFCDLAHLERLFGSHTQQ
jgi:hypothetical protein